MNILITGCTSFIGNNLVRLLLNEGHHVIGVCRNLNKAHDLLPSNPLLTIVILDMGQIDLLTKAVNEDIDIFVHLAWSGAGHDGRNNKEIQKKNLEESINAVNIASKLNCKLFVVAGSQAEYGQVNGILEPDTPCHPENAYGKAKYYFGIEAEKLCASLKMKFIHLRILSIYGEGDKDWVMINDTVRKMLRNEDVPLSYCTQMWNYVYVKDAVKQVYLLCKHALHSDSFKSKVYLIGSKDTRPLKKFIEEIYKLTKSKSNLLFGYYKPANIVELNPDLSETEIATNGFISDYTFAEGISRIIECLKQN